MSALSALFAYSMIDPPPRLLVFSISDDLAYVPSTKTEAQRKSYNVAILFESSSILTVNRDSIRGVINQGPFFVGIVEADISDKEQNIFL